MSKKLQALQSELKNAEIEFDQSVEADQTERANSALARVEALSAEIEALEGKAPVSDESAGVSAEAIGLEPAVVKEATTMSETPEGITISKQDLGVGSFEPVLAQLSPDQINALMVKVTGTEDLMALILPGTSVIDVEHKLHLVERGDVKRAARGLALAAAGGVDMDSSVILSNSGRTYTISDGICYELRRTEQPDFSGNVAVLEQQVPCKGHLRYNKTAAGFELTGGSHMRCLHQWALMFALGYFVTASEKTYASIVSTEIGQRVGSVAARNDAQAQIAEWTANGESRRETRTAFAQAIAHEKNVGNVDERGRLYARRDIAQFSLPDGKTVAQAVADLKGQQFTLTVELPLNGKTGQVVTRVVRNLSELADAIAPAFAVAAQNDGQLSVLEVNAR